MKTANEILQERRQEALDEGPWQLDSSAVSNLKRVSDDTVKVLSDFLDRIRAYGGMVHPQDRSPEAEDIRKSVQTMTKVLQRASTEIGEASKRLPKVRKGYL